jgi:hypothetical protein
MGLEIITQDSDAQAALENRLSKPTVRDNIVASQAERDADAFVLLFNRIAKDIHATAVDKGWWDEELKNGKRRNDAEMICLMHSELSEALESLRHGNGPDDHIPEFNGVEIELADCIVRMMDMAQARGYKVAEALVAKIAYNKQREKMHGGKKF